MNFGEAINSGLTNYATFSGRAARSEFWWFFLFVIVVVNIVNFVLVAISEIFGLIILALILPHLAVTVRRLHDIGWSGWWVLLGFIPFLNFLLLVFLCFPSRPNPSSSTQQENGDVAWYHREGNLEEVTAQMEQENAQKRQESDHIHPPSSTIDQAEWRSKEREKSRVEDWDSSRPNGLNVPTVIRSKKN